MGNCRAEDVLSYIRWVESLLIREARRLDPEAVHERDLSWDEWAELAGVNPDWQGYGAVPGEWVANVDLAMELYWPGEPPSSPHGNCAGSA